ncbi:MAG: histidine kinase [Lapillicoccus sp.]
MLLRNWAHLAASVALAVTALILVASESADASTLLVACGEALVPLAAPAVALILGGSRRSVGTALIAAVAAGPLRLMAYDPFRDPSCRGDCPPNPWALTSLGPTGQLILDGCALLCALALTVAAWGRRPAMGPTLVGAAAWLALPGLDQPRQAVELASVAVLMAVGSRSTMDLRRRAQLADLLHALDGASDIERTLREAVGDPHLTVGFVLDDGTLGSSSGRAAPAAGPGQVTTQIREGGTPAANVYHDPAATQVSALADALAGTARIALETGRLRAVQAAQAHLLDASHHRVQERQEDARRRLERDLHDGAQQHLLGLGLSLAAALDSPDSDDASRRGYEQALERTRWALAEVREIGHGLHRVGAGTLDLRAAIASLGERTTPSVTVVSVPSGPFPASTVRAICLLLENLAARSTGTLEVVVRRSTTRLTTTVRGGLSDHVDHLETDLPASQVFETLGGTLSVRPTRPGSPPVVEATLPAAPLGAQRYADSQRAASP